MSYYYALMKTDSNFDKAKIIKYSDEFEIILVAIQIQIKHLVQTCTDNSSVLFDGTSSGDTMSGGQVVSEKLFHQ